MSILTVASLATRVSSLSSLEPRRGDFRNIAQTRGRGFRGVNIPRRVAMRFTRRTVTVTPRASAMSAPEFAPGGKNSHLTALPPLRSWARARARANQHNRPPRDDERISETVSETKSAPFFRLVRDDDFDVADDFTKIDGDADVRNAQNSPDEPAYNVSETLVEETAGLVSLAKSAFSQFFFDRLYRQMFKVFLPGFPGVDAEHERASLVLRRERHARLGKTNGTLLDLGCGVGVFTEKFAAEGEYEAVVAVDDAKVTCDAVARRVVKGSSIASKKTQQEKDGTTKTNKHRRRRSNVSVVLASLEDLPFQDSVFDAAHSNAGAHTWRRPSRVVMETARVLKPGGVLVATVAVLDDASRRAMLERGVDSMAYAKQRQRCFSETGTGNMPFWDAETARLVFAKAPDLERCELEAVDQTFVMVTCAKKSRRQAYVPATRVIKRAGEQESGESLNGEKKNNAVQHTGRAKESDAENTRVVNGVYDASGTRVE
jgi:SAM-dependent methyltransferase